ncbi:MAG: hypothetical protein H0V93_12885 [Euzebyales bacterium]|jgi:hypothetical protein|nr:hypothetical protein [Euzebyales bacterium]
MTRQKPFKRAVRARMAKTGEPYTAAREQLLAKKGDDASDDAGEAPAPAQAPGPAPAFTPPYSGEVLERRTGKSWEQWFAVLDDWGAAERTHPEIASWLVDSQGVDGWWAQGVTVGYEQARGRRVARQRADGTFTVSASKTVNAPVERLFAAFVEAEARWDWLPDLALSVRTSNPHKSARFDVDDSTRVLVSFTAKGPAKSMAAVQHQRLEDVETTERMKAWWRGRLTELKARLEA